MYMTVFRMWFLKIKKILFSRNSSELCCFIQQLNSTVNQCWKCNTTTTQKERHLIHLIRNYYKYLINVTSYDITGNTIPFETESLLPAGDVVYVLAWNYAVNYLEKVMPGRVFVYSISPNTYQMINHYWVYKKRIKETTCNTTGIQRLIFMQMNFIMYVWSNSSNNSLSIFSINCSWISNCFCFIT